MEGNPELGSKGGVEEPVWDVEEIFCTTGKEEPSGKDSSVTAVKPTLVSVEAVTHESKADGDKDRRNVDWNRKTNPLEGAAVGQVAEGVGKKGRKQLEK